MEKQDGSMASRWGAVTDASCRTSWVLRTQQSALQRARRPRMKANPTQ